MDRSRRKFLRVGDHRRDSIAAAGDGAVSRSAINIASAILHCRPEKRGLVRAALCAMDGVEVHVEGDGGRLVVTVEDAPASGVAETLTRFNNLDGVIAVALVYQHCAHDEDDASPIHQGAGRGGRSGERWNRLTRDCAEGSAR